MTKPLSPPRHGGNLQWASAIAGCLPAQILDFSASINPLGCPPVVKLVLGSPDLFDRIHHYPDPSYTELRQAIASDFGTDVDWIVPGNGAAELLTWAGRDLAGFTQVDLLVPAFGDYFRALQAANAQINLCHRIEDLRGNRNKGLLLNNPHNPTGTLYERSQLLPLLESYGLVVIDEAFMDFLPSEASATLIDVAHKYKNLVILRSLTKFYALPGLRIGFAIADPDRLQQWQVWRDPWSVNCVAERVAIACLKDREFQQRTWQWLPSARSYLYQELAQIPWLKPYPSDANFLLVESQVSVLALQAFLLCHDRILIRDCLSFGELGDRFFRVCIRTKPDCDRLLEALSKYEAV